MYKAMIVDDHPVIRSTMKMILKVENFEVVAEADNGADAVQLARQHVPDLIILDISMPKLDGLEALSRITALKLSIKVLVMTSQSPVFYAMRCMKAGAAGYVSKTDEITDVVKAISSIMSGYTFFPNLTVNSVRRDDVQATELKLIESLSDRELAILQQLALGWSNKEIGDAMLLSNKTVSTYKARLIEKLNMKSLVHLSGFAKRNELI
ncbi:MULTISPECIES: response regulator transcription factor [unclassified Pseudomonas]|uniref:response regulator transcription factor n=1 Tax=unclassified Pseudomonas TaxID=196821 RepID=UPI002AC92F01|nr:MULTISPECIES: response regulator transcription factor [unclassified Pseudomonas]MEB0047326.1 response regulator transcription factor [Pseudomonas sp. Dout3]MEB0096578.1 response regulator transcription factor [Pseudomonas sp. DC1.2]WPX60301.1 response regulator transcription factor [Pseudomonas sp. DC1.2]